MKRSILITSLTILSALAAAPGCSVESAPDESAAADSEIAITRALAVNVDDIVDGYQDGPTQRPDGKLSIDRVLIDVLAVAQRHKSGGTLGNFGSNLVKVKFADEGAAGPEGCLSAAGTPIDCESEIPAVKLRANEFGFINFAPVAAFATGVIDAAQKAELSVQAGAAGAASYTLAGGSNALQPGAIVAVGAAEYSAGSQLAEAPSESFACDARKAPTLDAEDAGVTMSIERRAKDGEINLFYAEGGTAAAKDAKAMVVTHAYLTLPIKPVLVQPSADIAAAVRSAVAKTLKGNGKTRLGNLSLSVKSRSEAQSLCED